jgi:hypothetical protein
MKRTAIAVSVLALAGLVGCGSDPKQPAPVVVTPPPAQIVTTPPATAPAQTVVVLSPVAARPGFGRVESISAAPSTSAAAGGATIRRLGIKMEDGTMQMVDTTAGNVSIGDRVELTSDGKIRH